MFNRVFTITPSDSARVEVPHSALWVGLADATVAVKMQDGTARTFRVPSGVILPFKVTHVMATNTTSSLLVFALDKG
jgi:hypothetical protein